MDQQSDQFRSISLAVVGSGGAGAMTTGQMLFQAAAKTGLYGMFTRSLGPQIRGGEAAALLRLTTEPAAGIDDNYDLLVAIDWKNIERFAAELPLTNKSIIISDPKGGEVPEVIAKSGAQIYELPLAATARSVKGRVNMVVLGVVSTIIGLPAQALEAELRKTLDRKGEDAIQSSLIAVQEGRNIAESLPETDCKIEIPAEVVGKRWVMSGNEAAGFGAIKAGIRFVAAYPITPGTEVLEWMATSLRKVGGALVQAEDELASINMVVGGSYAGVPSLTATSGPGLALMTEGIGLAVAAEVPVVIVNVQRGGPSTGIPTKSEQSDLNIALYGLHGDAPHLVLAALDVSDCLFTTQWSVYLAEKLQTAAIVLSDQYVGQAKAAIDVPEDHPFKAERLIESEPAEDYLRYAVTPSGVSPMTIPGIRGGQYTADGLETNQKGLPSTQAEHHGEQMDKRLRKLTQENYGDYWAEVSGEGKVAIVTWGSTAGAVREAAKRLSQDGINVKVIAVRLISPAQPEKMAEALEGVSRILVVEQNHSAQFCGFFRANYDLPHAVESYNRPGPLIIRPGEIAEKIKEWGIK